jgi:hypothetical protein
MVPGEWSLGPERSEESGLTRPTCAVVVDRQNASLAALGIRPGVLLARSPAPPLVSPHA